MLGSWVHLLSAAGYLGSLVGLWIVLLPALSRLRSHNERVLLLARGLKLYNPVHMGALGFLVLSGAFQVTELKEVYRELLLRVLGVTLGLKLGLSFILIMLSAYQALALAHRFVRRYEGGETLSGQELESLARRLKISTLSILFLAAMAIWLGILLHRPS